TGHATAMVLRPYMPSTRRAMEAERMARGKVTEGRFYSPGAHPGHEGWAGPASNRGTPGRPVASNPPGRDSLDRVTSSFSPNCQEPDPPRLGGRHGAALRPPCRGDPGRRAARRVA